MLRDHEKTAVMSILAKVVECQDERERLEQEIAELSTHLNEVKAIRSAATSALRVFGFDTAGEGLWEKVKEEIGNDLYNQAFRIARPKPPVPPSNLEDRSDDEDDGESHEETADNEEESAGSDDSIVKSTKTESVDEGGTANIRELILHRLRDLGGEGAKANDLRQHVLSFGIDMHQKTVGMTLYRLKEAGLARRDGRMWFFVEPDQDNSAEGRDDAQSSVDTLEKGIFE